MIDILIVGISRLGKRSVLISATGPAEVQSRRLQVGIIGLMLVVGPARNRLLGDDAKPSAKGSLVSLRATLGTDKRIAIIAWGPDNARDLQQFPVLLSLARTTGVDTIWISGYRFLQLPPAQQQAVIEQANEARLRTLGFIDGDFDWPQNPRFVSRLYENLTKQLSLRRLGSLQVAFAVDIEPYHVPIASEDRGTKWNGDLKPAMNLIETIILPILDRFAKTEKASVDNPLLTRFEPFWYVNGHKPDESPALVKGTTLAGLRAVSHTGIAGMTYRNTAEQIVDVTRELWKRARLENVPLEIGVETIESEKAIGFFGREPQIGPALLGVYKSLNQADQARLRGVYIHTGGIAEAIWVLTRIAQEK
jgi:hypothetical protein